MSNEELDEAIDALQRKICAQNEAIESYLELAEADDSSGAFAHSTDPS